MIFLNVVNLEGLFSISHKIYKGGHIYSSVVCVDKTSYKNLQSILQEPLKYLKSPEWPFLALEVLKDPKTYILVRLLHKNSLKESYMEISKDFKREVPEYYARQLYEKAYIESLKDSL